MKRLVIFLLCIVCFQHLAFSQISNTGQMLDAMQVKNRGNWFKTLSFKQETIKYAQMGQKRDTAIWDEAVRYPDHFRIDYLDADRTVVFKADSAYRFEKGGFVGSRYQPQEFLLFKGGLYFIPSWQVQEKLEAYGYDLSKFREDRFKGQRVYVVGAEEGDLSTKQFWLNADHFYVVRRISKTDNGGVLDVWYENHKSFGKGWVEQKVTFYLNEQLLQIENYLDIKIDIPLSDQVFSTTAPLSDWYK